MVCLISCYIINYRNTYTLNGGYGLHASIKRFLLV